MGYNSTTPTHSMSRAEDIYQDTAFIKIFLLFDTVYRYISFLFADPDELYYTSRVRVYEQLTLAIPKLSS